MPVDTYTCLKQSALEYDGIDAYLGGDNFVAFLPDDDEVLNRIRQKIVKKLSEWNNTSAFFPSVWRISNKRYFCFAGIDV